MEYTDKFFEFPVKMYDIYDAINAEEEEDDIKTKTGKLEKVPIDYIVGVRGIDPDDIKEYNESYGKDDDVNEVRKNGFPHVIVLTVRGDVYECIWDRKKFKEKLNAFVKKREQTKDSKL